MIEKGEKKRAIKNHKKVSKDKKTITLKLNNGIEIPAKNIYIKKIQESSISMIQTLINKSF